MHKKEPCYDPCAHRKKYVGKTYNVEELFACMIHMWPKFEAKVAVMNHVWPKFEVKVA